MALAYLISLSAVSPHHEMNVIAHVISISVFIWLGLIGIVFLVHFLIDFLKVIRRNGSKKKNSQNCENGSLINFVKI